MTYSWLRHSPLFACLLGTTLATACGSTIDVPNQPPTAAIVRVQSSDGVVDIYYELNDAEGDDVAITIAFCQNAQCLTPQSAPGSDGVRNLPTDVDGPILHLFRWANPSCQVDQAGFDLESVIQITPNDGQTGDLTESEPFFLNDLGLVFDSTDCP
jgi:hypothetical protein